MKLLLVLICIILLSRAWNPNLVIDSLATSLVSDKNKNLIHVSFTYTTSYTGMIVHMHACVLTHMHKHIQIPSPLILKICHHFESIAFKASI